MCACVCEAQGTRFVILIKNVHIYTVEPLNNGQVGTLTLVHYSEVVLYWEVLVKAF